MMNVSQIFDIIDARLKDLHSLNDIALYNLMRSDIDEGLHNAYQRIYDDNIERISELHRLLHAITDTDHDIA